MLQNQDLNSEVSTERTDLEYIFSLFLAAQFPLIGTISIIYFIFHYPGENDCPCVLQVPYVPCAL